MTIRVACDECDADITAPSFVSVVIVGNELDEDTHEFFYFCHVAHLAAWSMGRALDGDPPL